MLLLIFKYPFYCFTNLSASPDFIFSHITFHRFPNLIDMLPVM